MRTREWVEEYVAEETMIVGSALGFSAHCSCGWVSSRFETEDHARDEISAHVVVHHAKGVIS